MNKFKKGISLLAVIAFLITALVPATISLAAETATITPTGASAVLQLNPNTADWTESVPTSAKTTFYIWKGTGFGTGLNSGQAPPSGYTVLSYYFGTGMPSNTAQMESQGSANPPGLIGSTAAVDGVSYLGIAAQDTNGNKLYAVYKIVPVTAELVVTPGSMDGDIASTSSTLTPEWKVNVPAGEDVTFANIPFNTTATTGPQPYNDEYTAAAWTRTDLNGATDSSSAIGTTAGTTGILTLDQQPANAGFYNYTVKLTLNTGKTRPAAVLNDAATYGNPVLWQTSMAASGMTAKDTAASPVTVTVANAASPANFGATVPTAVDADTLTGSLVLTAPWNTTTKAPYDQSIAKSAAWTCGPLNLNGSPYTVTAYSAAPGTAGVDTTAGSATLGAPTLTIPLSQVKAGPYAYKAQVSPSSGVVKQPTSLEGAINIAAVPLASNNTNAITLDVLRDSKSIPNLQLSWANGIVPSGTTNYTWSVDNYTIPTAGASSYAPAVGTAAGQIDTSVAKPNAATVTCAVSGSSVSAAKKTVTFTINVVDELTSPNVTGVRTSVNDGTPTDWGTPGGVVSATEGQGVTMQVLLGSTNEAGSMDYQWQYRSSSGVEFANLPSSMQGVSGVQAQTLRIQPVAEGITGYQYRCVVTPKGGSASSAANGPTVTLNIAPAQAQTIQPQVTLSSSPACTPAEVSETSNSGAVSIAAGNPITFTAAVTGVPAANLTYQWQRREAPTSAIPNPLWKPVQGADSSEYTLEAPQIASDTNVRYRCVVTNTDSSGSVEGGMGSDQFIELTVTEPDGSVMIISPTTPQTIEVFSGASAKLAVRARTDNGDPVAYQWQTSTNGGARWTNIEGATSGSYTTPVLTAEEGSPESYLYRCVATNQSKADATATSPVFTVQASAAGRTPVVTPPESAATDTAGAQQGGSVTLRVSASVPSGEPLSYQWYRQPATGAAQPLASTTNTLVLNNIPEAYNGNTFYCVVTNTAAQQAGLATASARSASWTLNVWQPQYTPVFTQNPLPVTATAGTSASTGLSMTAKLAAPPAQPDHTVPPYSYQWYYRANDSAEWAKATFTGNSGSAPTPVDGTITISWQPTGQTSQQNGQYKLRVTNTLPEANGAYAESSAATVDITVPNEPVITRQPANATTHVGESASFSVAATVTPTGTLVYRWQVLDPASGTWKNCTEADGTGANTPNFTTVLTSEAMRTASAKYQYRCAVSNRAYGFYVLSDPAELTILPAASEEAQLPEITEQPESVTVLTGAEAEFSVTAQMTNVPEGETPDELAFTWQFCEGTEENADHTWQNVTDEEGTVATQDGTSVLTVTAAAAMNGYEYRCIVSNASDGTVPSVTSEIAILTVADTLPQVPEIISQPEDAEVLEGQTAEFSVTAVMTNVPEDEEAQPLAFEWQVCTDPDADEPGWEAVTEEGTVSEEEGTSTLAVTAAMAMSGWQYRCIVTNADDETAPEAVSEIAVLTVSDVPAAIEPAEDSDLTIEDGALSGPDLTATADGNTVSQLLGMLKDPPEGYELRVESVDGEPLEDGDTVGTGAQLLLVDTETGDVVEALDIVVRGDVMGTGKLSLSQLVQMAQVHMGERELTRVQQLAGDLNGDGESCTLTDLVQEAALYRSQVLGEE